MIWTDFHILFCFFSRHDRYDAYLCKLGGTEKSQGRPLVLQTHIFATLFKAPPGGHKAKEKGMIFILIFSNFMKIEIVRKCASQ